MTQSNDTFKEIKIQLFQRQNKRDFIEIFFELGAHKFCRGERPHSTENKQQKGNSPLEINRTGNEHIEIPAKPCGSLIKRSGEGIYNDYIKHYNTVMYLPSLWFAIHEVTKKSALGREFLRAFIKNSLFASAEVWVIASHPPYTLNRKTISATAEIDKFYFKLFDFKEINRCMRQKWRKKFNQIPADPKVVKKFSALSTKEKQTVFENSGLGELKNVIETGIKLGEFGHGNLETLEGLIKPLLKLYYKNELKREIRKIYG